MTSVEPDPIPLTQVSQESGQVIWIVANNGGQSTQPLTLAQTGFDPAEVLTASACLGQPLPPATSCTLRISFRPRLPTGTRNVTLTVVAGPLEVSTQFSIPVRQGAAGTCTLGNADECAPGLFCTTWYLDQDEDGYGGEPSLGGAPTLSVCSNGLEIGRPAAIVEDLGPVLGTQIRPYVLPPNVGDCCDLPGRSMSTTFSAPFNVNPGVSTARTGAAPDCPNPDDFNCDGEAVCTEIRAEDGTLCL